MAPGRFKSCGVSVTYWRHNRTIITTNSTWTRQQILITTVKVLPTGLGLASIDIQLWYKHVCISSSSLRPTMVAWPESSVSLFLIYKKNQITPIQQTAFCPQAKSLPLWTPIRTQAQNSGMRQRSVIRKDTSTVTYFKEELVGLVQREEEESIFRKAGPLGLCVCVGVVISIVYNKLFYVTVWNLLPHCLPLADMFSGFGRWKSRGRGHFPKKAFGLVWCQLSFKHDM